MNEIHPHFAKRSAGVLLHVSSLDGGHGIGDFGPSARRFIDWLSASGWSIWQVLPIGPLGKGDSPYSSPSSFAIEPILLSLEGDVTAAIAAMMTLDDVLSSLRKNLTSTSAHFWKLWRN